MGSTIKCQHQNLICSEINNILWNIDASNNEASGLESKTPSMEVKNNERETKPLSTKMSDWSSNDDDSGEEYAYTVESAVNI